MSYSFGDVIYCPQGSSLATATSTIGSMRCYNSDANMNGSGSVISNDYTLGNPVSYILPFYSGLFHPNAITTNPYF